MIGRPIFNYPPERRAPEGEGCVICGIVLEADAIGSHCSPECCEWTDRCDGCQRGPTWCECEYTHCIDCDDPLTSRDRERQFRTCKRCAKTRREARFGVPTTHQSASNKEIA